MSSLVTTRFQIEDLVDQDERGVTYVAKDKETGLKVALRRFFRERAESMKRTEYENFRKELKNAITLKHPNLRRVLGGGIDDVDKVAFMATVWVEGLSISQRTQGKYIEPAEGVVIARQAIELMMFLQDKTPLRISLSPKTVVQLKSNPGTYTFWFCVEQISAVRKGTRRRVFFKELVAFLNSVLRQATIIGDSHYCRLRGWMDLLESSGFTYEEALRSLPTPEETVTPLPGMKGAGVLPAVDATHVYNEHVARSTLDPPSVPTAKIRKAYKRHTLWKKEKEYKQNRLVAICAGGAILIILALVVVSIVTNQVPQ